MDVAWFMGIDLGTGSCKSAVVDRKARVLGFGVGEYTAADAQDRWQEQDPEVILAACFASVRIAVADAGVAPENCGGLSLGSALHSLMALDERGDPLTGVMTWADGRAVSQSARIRESAVADRLYRETGCPVTGMYPLYKIMWLRENRPEIFRRTRRFVSIKEYVFFRLTGEFRIDYSLAAGSGMLNAHCLQWNPLCLDLAGIGDDRLSPLFPPLSVHEGLNPDLARGMGIPADIPVVLGSSDAVNSSLGAGAVGPGQATCMVGTSGALRVISPRPVLDAKARSWCYAIDEAHWLVGGAINNGGVALSWLKDGLNQAFAHLPPDSRLSFDDMLTLAGQAEPGAGGVICLPFFAGERSPNWNLNARAAFFGMTICHDMRHLCRSLIEGIAFRLRNLHDVLTEMGIETRQIIASGGFTKSDLWLQVVADGMNRELHVPPWSETSALGAALWPLLAAGAAKTLEEIGALVETGSTCRPIAANAAVYDRIYPLYLRLYQALAPSFDEVAKLQQELGALDCLPTERRNGPVAAATPSG